MRRWPPGGYGTQPSPAAAIGSPTTTPSPRGGRDLQNAQITALEDTAATHTDSPLTQPSTGVDYAIGRLISGAGRALRLSFPGEGTDLRPFRRAGESADPGIMRTYDIHAETRQAQPTAVSIATLPVPEIASWFARIYGVLASVIAAHGAGPAGPPFARYHKLPDGRFTIEAGFPVTAPVGPEGDERPSQLPGGQVAVTIHTGRYDEMAGAYEALTAWVTSHGGEVTGDPWEVYLSDPASEPDPATWRTQIVQPCRLA